jgi:hypothetical protein
MPTGTALTGYEPANSASTPVRPASRTGSVEERGVERQPASSKTASSRVVARESSMSRSFKARTLARNADARELARVNSSTSLDVRSGEGGHRIDLESVAVAKEILHSADGAAELPLSSLRELAADKLDFGCGELTQPGGRHVLERGV